jgi:hypothetical protein
MLNRRPSVIVAAILFAALMILANCRDSNQPEDSELTFLNHNDSVEYIGMDLCGQCHPDQHKTFSHTGMGSSFGLADLQKTSASFHNDTIVDPYTNLRYVPYFDEGKLYIKEIELDENNQLVFERIERVDYIVGSGQHTNSHLMLRNGYVVQAPLTYYTQDKKWDLPPGFEKGNNSRFNRIIDTECMSCHNAIPTLNPKHKRKFATIGSGIDCERCHGPGELHMKFRQNEGSTVRGKFDSTIVNPKRLSSARLIDLCQRCHLQGNNVLKPGKQFADFKPGMKLSDIFEVYLPNYEGDHSEFNMADHSQRMQMSQCYVGSDKALTCINCHNPHVSVLETRSDQFNSECISCHQDKKCSLPIEQRQADNNSCFKCHMPISTAKDILHVRVHDHKIQIPSNEEKSTNKTLVGLYSVNNEHPSNDMLIRAYLSYYEKFDAQDLYLYKASELLNKSNDFEAQIHYLFLKESWTEIVRVTEERYRQNEYYDPYTPYRIAVAYGKVKKYPRAEFFYKLAISSQPDRFEFRDELGNIYLKQNKIQKAKVAFEESIEWYPFNAKAYNNLGYCLFLESDYSRARLHYEKALKLDHHYSPALENMALLLLELNQYANAKKYLAKAELYSDDKVRIQKAIKQIEQNYE